MSDLIENLKIDAEWAEGHEWDAPICLQDDLLAAIAAVEKLKAYEDTGLEPEEIKELRTDMAEVAKMFRKMIESGEINHVQNLLQAEKDGRLVVLPCRDDVELERNGQTFRADHWNHSLTAFRDAPETKSGKQVALFSIEEAEAALEGGGE